MIAAAEFGPESRLEVEGFAKRPLVAMPALPVQYATDAVRPTVVQALIDSEGLVLSCRVLESSGSKVIDHAAMELSRKARLVGSLIWTILSRTRHISRPVKLPPSANRLPMLFLLADCAMLSRE